ncbi:MAG: FHA domain-containing protein [Caldilineaceae bacterium]|nr:FHA domain-containing protein [Caldilineaceae bacterium]
MVTCPTCNAPNDPSAGFCDQCGTSLQGAVNAPVPASFAPPPAPNFAVGGGSVCPQCGAQVIAGEMFCENCGAALGSLAPVVSSGGGYAPAPVVQPPINQPSFGNASAFPPPPVSASAQLSATDGQTYQLSGKTTYLLGRKDDVSGNYPDVDTGDPGLQAGVSRRHAEVYQQGMQWFVRDLNSVNGTWVNTQRLAPNGSMPVSSGDSIRLGKWAATFRG